MLSLSVKVSRVSLGTPSLPLPQYATSGSAGMDLHACLEAPLTLLPGQRCLVSTGLSMAIPEGWEGQVRPRSGLALRHGISVLNAPGTIDSDYRGEVKVILVHLGDSPFEIRHGDRIAQLVFAQVARAEWIEVERMDSDSVRGSGGFGHTGV